MKLFYIIEKDKTIHELGYSKERYEATIQAHANGDVLMLKPIVGEPYTIVASNIAKVLSQEKYYDYRQTMPKSSMYLLKGTWYDCKENKVVQHTQWKTIEMERRLKLRDTNQTKSDLTEEERELKIKEINETLFKLKEQHEKNRKTKTRAT